jgi:hypothetical protein
MIAPVPTTAPNPTIVFMAISSGWGEDRKHQTVTPDVIAKTMNPTKRRNFHAICSTRAVARMDNIPPAIE